MARRRNDQDVTARIRTTDPLAVRDELCRIFSRLYPRASTDVLERGVRDATRLYRGEYPGYATCDTGYHDLQHTLEVALAMARIMAGYQVLGRPPALTPALFRFGVLAALFHDAGYIRRTRDVAHDNGAEYTRVHVSRGARFLREYLPRLGMERFVSAAAPVLHFTGYERRVERIRVPDPVFRLLGNMLGSADIIAQMADRCYLEKCYERLYPEFVLGGIDRREREDGSEEIIFASAEDLIYRTPEFYRKARERLEEELGAAVRFAGAALNGHNLYVEAAEKNIQYADRMAKDGDLSGLRRRPPREGGPDEGDATASTGDSDSNARILEPDGPRAPRGA